MLAAGTVIGGEFVVERPLRKGGMSTLYLARQRSTHRLRVLKFLTPEVVADPKSRERFAREALAGSLIESEHVVEVITAGIDDREGGTPWLALEYLEGEELTTHVERQPEQRLPRKHAHLVLEQIFHALSAAHRAGVVHRDIKPENVFLAQTRLVGVPFLVKVLDFGIAKILSETRPSSQTESLGTPGWLAPEQFRSGVASPAADVWSLALLTFFVLTGRRFWLCDQDPKAGIQQLFHEMLVEPIPLASERAGQYGRAELVPSGYDSWFASCLRRESSERLTDASCAWAALSPVLQASSSANSESENSVAVHCDHNPPEQQIKQVPTEIAPVEPPRVNTIPNGGTVQAAPLQPVNRTVPQGPPPSEALSNPPSAPQLGGDPKRTYAASASQGRLLILFAGALVAVLGAYKIVTCERSEPSDSGKAQARTSPLIPIPADTESAVRSSPQADSRTAKPPVLPPRSGPCPPDMTALPAGKFRFGSSSYDEDEKPERVMSVNACCLDTTEVTVRAYQKCVEASACKPATGGVYWRDIPKHEKSSLDPTCNAGRPERLEHPINCVDFAQAESYCRWTGKRLPTESEWEFAAAGPRSELYPWGGLFSEQSLCWRRGLSEGTCRVSSYAGVSHFGLQDLAGNVWEWTSTPYVCKSPPCPPRRMVGRGGGWSDRNPNVFRCANKDGFIPENRYHFLGFRCAKDL